MAVRKSKKDSRFWEIQGQITIDGEKKRYHKESIKDSNFKSKKWCEEEEHRMRDEIKKKNNLIEYSKNLTLKDLEEEFLVKIEIEGAKERTIQAIKYRMKNYYEKFFGADTILKYVLAERKVEQFKAWIIKLKYSCDYKNTILTNFSQMVTFACDRKIISSEEERAISKSLKRIKNVDPVSEIHTYTPPEDAKKVWESAKNEFFSDVFQLFYYSGCRISEFLAIQKKDVTFFTNNGAFMAKVHINKQCFNQNERLKPYLKNSNSVRDIYFVNDVAHTLENYIQRYKFDEGDIIFNISKNNMRRALNDAFKKAGVPHNTFHGFGRKSIATYLYVTSKDAKLPQMLLGHKEVDMTLNTYILNDALRENLLSELTNIETIQAKDNNEN